MSHETWCRHFTGIDKGTCKAGISYESVKDTSSGNWQWICCYPKSPIPCPLYELHTPEEIKAQEEEWGIRLNHILAALTQIKPLRKRGVTTTGHIECPACKGKLNYSISGYNGHVHGKCETPGCVQWME